MRIGEKALTVGLAAFSRRAALSASLEQARARASSAGPPRDKWTLSVTVPRDKWSLLVTDVNLCDGRVFRPIARAKADQLQPSKILSLLFQYDDKIFSKNRRKILLCQAVWRGTCNVPSHNKAATELRRPIRTKEWEDSCAAAESGSIHCLFFPVLSRATRDLCRDLKAGACAGPIRMGQPSAAAGSLIRSGQLRSIMA